MTLEAWKELRRWQGVRVANASRHRRSKELEVYETLNDEILIREAQQEAFSPTLPLFQEAR
jgi:hypothetical protein